MNGAIVGKMASWTRRMEQIHQTILSSNSTKIKRKTFKEPKYFIESMEEFEHLEELLSEKRYRRFIVSKIIKLCLDVLNPFSLYLDQLVTSQRNIR
jgi:hypothetical protein